MVNESKRSILPFDDASCDGDDIAFEEDVPAQACSPALIETLARLPGALREGAIFCISLESVRDRLGPEWSRLRPRVREIFENALKDRLESKDVFLRVNDESYVISFAGGNAAHASIKAAKIAQSVREKLFGDSPVEAEVKLLSQPLLDSVHVQKSEKKMAAAAEQKRLVGSRVAQASKSRELNYIFTPVWDAVHKVLSTYVCTPMQNSRAGVARYGAELLPANAGDLERAQFYAHTLEFALEVAQDLYRNQFAVFTSVQCDYQALTSPKGREAYYAVCRQIPPHLKKMMRLQLIGSGETVPTTTLTERVGNLKAYFRTVTVRIDSLDDPIKRFSFMGLHALSYPVNAAAGFDYAKAAHAIKQARNAKMYFAFSRVPDLLMADRLVAIGATYLSGKFLGDALDAPENMMRCTLDDLGRMQAG